MLALSFAGVPLMDQASGFIIAVISLATAAGGFFAGRVTFRQSVVDNAKVTADSWKAMYEAAKEQNIVNEIRITELIKEGHEKDVKIAELNGKITIIMEFMKQAMGKDFSSVIETKTSTK